MNLPLSIQGIKLKINPQDWQISAKASRVGGWVASVTALFPAAYTSYLHMTTLMGYEVIPAAIIAGAVETLGYMIVSATVTAMERSRRGLVVLGVLAFAGYLVVIVLLNLILTSAEAISPEALTWAKIIAGADLALLSVPAAILAAIQSQLLAGEKHAQANEAKQAQAERTAQANAIQREKLDRQHAIDVLKLNLAHKAAEADKKRVAKQTQQPATSAAAESAPAKAEIAELEPCQFGCPKMVRGFKGQNAHADSCPNNPDRKVKA